MAIGTVEHDRPEVVGTIHAPHSPVEGKVNTLWARSVRRVSNRAWPVVLTGVVLIAGMAYMLWWGQLVHHEDAWITGGDMWGIFRAAHYIGWGFVGWVYDPSTGVNSLPGLEVLLTPLAMISSHLGLTESAPPFFLMRPQAALLLEPVELLLASTVLFATDALAQELKVPKGRRITLCVCTAIVAWPTVALWGHAEDCLALALALYSLEAGIKGRWKACGWLFGFALVTQPLVVMMLPLVIGASPRGQRIAITLRSVALSAVFVIIVFASDAGDAFRALIQQPTPPSVNHATPWVALAPRVANPIARTLTRTGVNFRSGRFIQTSTLAPVHSVELVSGGAGRSVEVLVAILIGIYAWRRPPTPEKFVWLAAVCLGMRCMFEAVMTPYYLAPPLILVLAIASCRSVVRFGSSVALAFSISIYAYYHLSPWTWWLPIVGGMTAVLLLARPGGRWTGSTHSESDCLLHVAAGDSGQTDMTVSVAPNRRPELVS